MRRSQGRFFWKLFLGNALLLIGVVAVCVWLILDTFDRFYADELTAHLRTHAAALRHQAEGSFSPAQAAELDSLAKAVGRSGPNGLRVTFVAANGLVLGDSDRDPAEMESHANRPEILQALSEGWGESTRWSDTLRLEMKYVALRLGPADAPRGVVRVSMGLRSIVARTHVAHQLIRNVVLVVLVGSVCLALGLAVIWSKRIARITAAAQSLSRGDLSARAEVSGSDELTLLARLLNQMRDNLATQLDTIDRQRRTLEYLLAQLREGVIVTAAGGRVVLLNPAAVKLLGSPSPPTFRLSQSVGLAVEECIPQPELQDILRPRAAALENDAAQAPLPAGDAPVEKHRLTFRRDKGPITVLVRASNILLPGDAVGGSEGESPAAEQSGAGRLLVLTDITELDRTIQVKADFVANASHELRTPLSAIRAAVETLLSMDLVAEAESAHRALAVIDRQSGRLEALVADLLNLSRIESPSAQFRPTVLRLEEVIGDVYDRFAGRIAGKKLEWQVELFAGANRLLANRDLLNLVFDNLVDNAIKFTDEGGTIRIRSERDEQRLRISVEDTGCGIPAEDQDRVFERFYQVERSRSGAARGTGLGLSIVRHAVNAMGGKIRLQSQVGQGTTLEIILPQPAPDQSAGS